MKPPCHVSCQEYVHSCFGAGGSALCGPGPAFLSISCIIRSSACPSSSLFISSVIGLSWMLRRYLVVNLPFCWSLKPSDIHSFVILLSVLGSAHGCPPIVEDFQQMLLMRVGVSLFLDWMSCLVMRSDHCFVLTEVWSRAF